MAVDTFNPVFKFQDNQSHIARPFQQTRKSGEGRRRGGGGGGGGEEEGEGKGGNPMSSGSMSSPKLALTGMQTCSPHTIVRSVSFKKKKKLRCSIYVFWWGLLV